MGILGDFRYHFLQEASLTVQTTEVFPKPHSCPLLLYTEIDHILLLSLHENIIHAPVA